MLAGNTILRLAARQSSKWLSRDENDGAPHGESGLIAAAVNKLYCGGLTQDQKLVCVSLKFELHNSKRSRVHASAHVEVEKRTERAL